MSVCRIGLTGGIGSGKSTVADLFAQHGVVVVDTDAIAHALTAPGSPAIAEIVAAFGAGVRVASGALDRAALRQRVFSSPSDKQRLEAILHPRIRAEAETQCAAAGSPYVLLVVPLLLEAGNWASRVMRVLVVDCEESTQRARVRQRSGLSENEVAAIMATQLSRAERLAAADDIIVNDGELSALDLEVERLHYKYLALCAEF